MSADLDKAIDGAVREMLDGEPRADLRARVLAQLLTPAEAPGGKPGGGSRLPRSGFRLPAPGWVLVPLVAAAMIVLAVFVARRSEPLPQAPAVGQATDRYLPSERVAAAPPPAVGVHDTRRAASQSRPPAPQVTRDARPSGGTVLAAAYLGDDDAAAANNATTKMEPLKTMTPIAVTPITQDSIAPAQLALRPLATITEVQIAPLTPPDRR